MLVSSIRWQYRQEELVTTSVRRRPIILHASAATISCGCMHHETYKDCKSVSHSLTFTPPLSFPTRCCGRQSSSGHRSTQALGLRMKFPGRYYLNLQASGKYVEPSSVVARGLAPAAKPLLALLYDNDAICLFVLDITFYVVGELLSRLDSSYLSNPAIALHADMTLSRDLLESSFGVEDQFVIALCCRQGTIKPSSHHNLCRYVARRWQS